MLFFSKKYYLTDYLEGFIDIHNHILPAIDDGAKDLETSLHMIDLYKELGFKSCIATPHTMEDYYGNDVDKIRNCYQNFKNEKTSFVTGAASEYMMDGNFENLIDTDHLLFLKERILLTEFSYFQRPHYVEEVVFKMLQKDISPILAHPERYRYIKSIEEFQDLKDRGFTFQLNMLSLSGRYGKDALNKAKLLLQNNLYDFIATDAHKPEHLSKIKEIKLDKKITESIQPVILNTIATFS
ncbi:MAG: tyrosine-protein phosphatase [Nonlabens sp.]|uniref:tyrosine-protein phosphatase n=1 Tax=Nonlabens sp. TaxID=1888209 RepID=UPI003EF87E8B